MEEQKPERLPEQGEENPAPSKPPARYDLYRHINISPRGLDVFIGVILVLLVAALFFATR